MRKVILTVGAFLLTMKLMAQAPEKMSYQAVIRNSSNGLVISAPVGMRISVLQGSAAGPSVYTETQTPTSNANGLVSIEVGAGTVVSGNFSTIDWANDTYFIKTETDPTGGVAYTVVGTSQLMSVPYALHAKSAETVVNNDDADADPTNELQNWSTLPGIPADIADGDDVDDADADPANEIELPVGGNNAQVLSTDGSGSYSWVDQTVNTLPDGTTAGQTAHWDGTSWVVDNALFNDGTNVGIGTTSPGRKLEVNGAIKIGNTSLNPDDGTISNAEFQPGLNIIGINTDATNRKIGYYGSLIQYENLTPTGNVFLGNTTVDGTTLTVDATNNHVGIGTATPTSAKLVIAGASGEIGLDLATTDQYADMRVLRNPSGDKDMYFGLGSGATGADLKFYGNNTERMTINSGVGIGTTTPTQPLDVVGNVKFSGALMPNNLAGTAGQVLTSAGAGTAPTWTTPGSSSNLYSADGTLAGNRIVTQGANTLSFTGSAVNAFSVDGTTMSVDAANNRLGIGTAAPVSQLSVGANAGTAVGQTNVALISGNNIETLGLQGSTTGTNLSFYKQGSASRQAAIASNVNALGSDIVLYTTNTTGTTDQNRMVIKADGNIGIGTTIPSERLDVIGNMKFTGALMPNNISGTTGQILTSAGAGTAPTWTTPTITNIYTADGTLGGNRIVTQGANTLAFNGTAVNAFSVDGTTFSVDATNDRVGIGNVTPTAKLDVAGPMTANSIAGQFRNGNPVAGGSPTQIAFGYSNSDQYRHFIATRHNAGGSVNNSIDFYTSDGTAAGVFPTNAVHNMTLSGGNVGIGTTAPVVKLHVNAVMRLEPQAAAPATAGKGDMYFNGTTNKLMVFDGTVWQACW